MLRLPRNYKIQQHKVLRLPRENDKLTCTRFYKVLRLARKTQTQSQRMSQNVIKHAICGKIDLQHIILITFCERRPTVRLSDLTANVVRTCCGRSSNAGRTRLQPPELNENPSLRIREHEFPQQTSPTSTIQRRTVSAGTSAVVSSSSPMGTVEKRLLFFRSKRGWRWRRRLGNVISLKKNPFCLEPCSDFIVPVAKLRFSAKVFISVRWVTCGPQKSTNKYWRTWLKCLFLFGGLHVGPRNQRTNTGERGIIRFQRVLPSYNGLVAESFKIEPTLLAHKTEHISSRLSR